MTEEVIEEANHTRAPTNGSHNYNHSNRIRVLKTIRNTCTCINIVTETKGNVDRIGARDGTAEEIPQYQGRGRWGKW